VPLILPLLDTWRDMSENPADYFDIDQARAAAEWLAQERG
jgi:hypothetical protein